MGYKKRVDKNQSKVVRQLREMGFSVRLTYTVGKGFPDFVIGMCGVNYLVELKSEGGKLTSDEQEFFDNWKGQIDKHFSAEEIASGFVDYAFATCSHNTFCNVTSKLSGLL